MIEQQRWNDLDRAIQAKLDGPAADSPADPKLAALAETAAGLSRYWEAVPEGRLDRVWALIDGAARVALGA